MKQQKPLNKTFLYKWRYAISYVAMVLVMMLILITTGLYAPSGISNSEVESAITSQELSINNMFTGSRIIDLPYRILQKASISTFGLSNFSVTFPSIFIAAVANLALFVLISDWTNRRAAILSTLIVIISSRYAFLAQYGTPIISHIGLSIILVAILSRITRKAEIISEKHISKSKLTKWLRIELGLLVIALFATIALTLYSPLGAFTVFIVIATMLFHPHVRSAFHKIRLLIPRWYYLIGASLGLALLLPLATAGIKNPEVVSELFKINNFNFDLKENMLSAARDFLDIRGTDHGIFIGPWFNLSALVLILVGFWREVKTAYKPRSAMIIMWVLSAAILALFSTDSHIVLFTPLALSLSMGLNYIIKSWYSIFPRNPYARILGLIPIVLIISSLVFVDIQAYVDAYRYQPGVADRFHDDLGLLGHELAKSSGMILITEPDSDEQKFYQIFAISHPELMIADKYSPGTNLRQVATRAAHANLKNNEIDRILASPFLNQSDRFYVYKKSAI